MIISKKKYNDNHYTRLEEMKTTTTIITTTTMIDEIKEVNDDGRVFVYQLRFDIRLQLYISDFAWLERLVYTE